MKSVSLFCSTFILHSSHLERVQLPVAQFSHAFPAVRPSLPVSQVAPQAAWPAWKNPVHTTGRNNFYLRDSLFPMCTSWIYWQFRWCQFCPNGSTILSGHSLLTSKPLTSRLASSMVWLVDATSSWQLIFSVVAFSNWVVRLCKLLSRSWRHEANRTIEWIIKMHSYKCISICCLNIIYGWDVVEKHCTHHQFLLDSWEFCCGCFQLRVSLC